MTEQQAGEMIGLLTEIRDCLRRQEEQQVGMACFLQLTEGRQLIQTRIGSEEAFDAVEQDVMEKMEKEEKEAAQ